MKTNSPLLLKYFCALFFFAQIAQAQAQDSDCLEKQLFTSMPNHKVYSCSIKEFDKLEMYETIKNNTVKKIKKGQLYKIEYDWTGDWSKRPSNIQIQENYINAVKKEGGKLLYQEDNYLYLSLQKEDINYWIQIFTDGSGLYVIHTLHEKGLQQDIVLNKGLIKKGLKEKGKVILSSIFFDTNKATIKRESKTGLAVMASYLNANPNLSVYIVGHTDNRGDFDYNMLLSKKRAQAVINELTSIYKVKKAQIKAYGVGSLSPISTHKNKNRRVEMVLAK